MASSGSVAIRYEVKCDFVPQKTLISPSSSSSVVFTVQSILRLSVAGNPMTEFLEKKDWRERRQSSLELPWSTDEGLIIDDDHNLKISETLTLLYVPKSYHQLIIRRVPPQSVGALHLVGVAPKILVHLLEVTHLTLPLIDEQGRAICPEGRRDYAVMNYGLQTEKEEFDQAKFVDSLKKLIVVAGGIDEEEESAYIDKWFWDVIHAIKRLAWPVTKKAIVVDDEEERTCPICLEIILELHKTWRKMPCCSKAFHCDCISIWTTEPVKNCPWCRSSLPLVLQSAKGLILNVDRQTCQEMSDITLCFGCQTSNERFSTLWSAQNVSIKFGSGLNEILFFLSYREVEYKLQLSHEHFWQIMLYTTGGRNDKFLVIQLFAAPLIFKRTPGSMYSYFKEFPNDQWVRTTDFSQNLIGQSSGFCLTIPAGVTLPDFRSNLVHCLEVQSPFILEQGSPFSSNLDLVPIMYPPQGVVLPFKLLFRICALVQHGCLPGPLLNADFFHLVDPQWRDINCIEYALAKMFSLHECCYDPVQWLTQEYEKFKYSPVSTFINLENGLVYVHRALVTPIRVYFCGPEVNKSNRVLRHYIDDIDNFLRVSFVDEDWDKIQPADLSSRASGKTAIYDRMLGILRNGIVIGDKRFEFLAFSSSQLREGSIWMFASRDGLTAADIRAWMGDFKKIKNVAKYAARLGQSFGSSTETLSIPRDEIEIVPDIKIRRQGKEYNFSDGIGKISKEFSEIVAIKCGLEKFTPSAFQIRYGGFKGVVSVDPSSSKKLSLRNSMLKYESDNLKLDVLAWSKYQPCYLNRQLVTLLSTLGIKDEVFERKQSEAVAQLNAILTDPNKASEAFELMAPGGENTNIIKEMLLCGYKPDSEPFLSMTLQAFRALKLQDLRTKARIFIPSARSMMGCLDETRTLEYGEVFVQYSGTNRRLSLGDAPLFAESSNCNYIVSGYVAVAKNPCLHPGDVRVLRAVNVPALRHMVDCVVFPQKGQRPHPNECSGSDLDGDIYFVCWDQDLIPKEMKQPMDYTPAPSMELDHDVTMEEVQKYFVDYMVNDSLGRISNAHVVFADKEAQKAMSEPCLELAKLFSVAVDFPKTGVPAKMPSHLFVKEYPDFMEKPSDQKTYVSSRVIGKLYRAVKDISLDVITSFTREDAVRWYDADLEVEGFKGFIRDAVNCKTEYDFMLRILMESYGINSEAEMLCGGVIKPSKVFDHKKDPSAVHFALKALKKEARSWFMQGSQSREDSLAKASAWYHVTYHPTYWGRYNKGGETDHLISFPWCVYDKIIEIKRFKTRMR